MTKEETIRVLQSIEDRAVDFPYMTACDWVAIAAAKRHLKDSLEVGGVDLEEEIKSYFKGFGKYPSVGIGDCIDIARHFFEFGFNAQKK